MTEEFSNRDDRLRRLKAMENQVLSALRKYMHLEEVIQAEIAEETKDTEETQ
jgi:hypothetical protein